MTYLRKAVWTSDLFYVLSLAASKLAVASLFHRFSAVADRIRFFKGLMYATGVYAIVGLLITALRQPISRPWRYTVDTAPSNMHRWLAFGVMSAVLDAIALLSPLYLTWNIQMDRRSKLTVIVAFASRAPCIVFDALRIAALVNLNAEDFSWGYITPEIYTQLEMHYSLISATIPCLRIFLRAWHTRFLDLTLEEVDERAYAKRESRPGRQMQRSLLTLDCFCNRCDSERVLRNGINGAEQEERKNSKQKAEIYNQVR